MDFIEFKKQYNTEQKCIDFFKETREKQGIHCLKCRSKLLKWDSDRNLWVCKKCNYKLGLRKNTIMENSKLSFNAWLTTLYLMSYSKKEYSAVEIQNILGHKRYEPIWQMMHKIRIKMGEKNKENIPKDIKNKKSEFIENQQNTVINNNHSNIDLFHRVAILEKNQAYQKTSGIQVTFLKIKRKINGLHHQVKKEYLENYLNEFYYRNDHKPFSHLNFDKLIIMVFIINFI